MSALVVGAVNAAKRAKAPALEAYPVDLTQHNSTGNVFTGIASTFLRAGFRTIGSLTPSRLIMRNDLKRVAK